MRRFAPSFLKVLLVVALVMGVDTQAWAQSPRTAPLPLRNVGRMRLFPRKQAEEPQAAPQPKSSIPTTPPGKPQPAATAPEGTQPDDVLVQAKRAIEINKRRFLDPTIGHSPWMILHGALALRQDYELMIGNRTVNAIEYITKRNPVYAGSLPDPQRPGSPLVRVQRHWFEATAHGGRAQPYVVSFAFEGHTNQFLAILSMSNLPLTHEFTVNDPQKPGATKTITMADMVRHAKMNVHVGNPNEVAWTLWFLANYLEADEKWVDKDGLPWSMEQLVTIQTNAPLFSGAQDLAPCGGTHGLFALACACNSYQAKHGKLHGAWLAARQKLDNHVELARRLQNRDGSFSTEFFRTTGYSPLMGPRFKSSGHMLEWLMMAMAPEQLEQQWVRSAVMNVANDLVRWGGEGLGTADTGAMYHALHALVLYRNRIEPPTKATPPATAKPPEQLAEVPPEMKKPAPGDKPATDPKSPPADDPEALIRLIDPSMNKLSPLGSVRPLLRPITNSRDTGPQPQPTDVPEPPPMAEKIGEPQPVLEKPAPTTKPAPVPGEPKSEGAVVVPLTEEEGGTAPVPLFGEEPAEMQPLPEPTPAKNPTTSD